MLANAKRLADSHGLTIVRRCVGHWWDNRNGQFRSPGIIVTWLDDLDNAGIPACSTEFLRSPLYRQWRTEAEIQTERETEATWAAYLLEAAGPEAEVVDAEPQGPLVSLWQQILASFAPDLVEAWLAGTQLIELSTRQAVITAPRRKAEYIRNRLARGIRRELTLQGHRPDEIIIQEASDDA
jgi:hypothetical protein